MTHSDGSGGAVPPQEPRGAVGCALPTVGWLAAGLLPAPAALVGWRDLVMGHLWLAFGLLGLYWVLLTAGRFAAGFVRDLGGLWRARFLKRADEKIASLVSGFEADYKSKITRNLAKVEQTGLSFTGGFAPLMDEVFIDVGLARRPPVRVRDDMVPDPEPDAGERTSILDHLDRSEPAVLAILGAPGSGKTTLLRHTARQACQAADGRRRRIPILLILRDHAARIIAEPRVGIAELLRDTLGDLGGREPAGWFEERLRGGECVVLLDGLDEVADEDDRRRIRDWVERRIADHPENDYVITSRPKGYRVAPVDGATALETRPFTDDQVSRFVGAWYRAYERRESREGHGDLARAEERAADLRGRLRDTPQLYELTANPLLLTMIVNVHQDTDGLPGSRSDLYGEICRATLWTRRERRGLPVRPRGAQKERLLQVLAYAMMRDRVQDLPEERVHAAVRRTVRRVSRDLTPAEFVADATTDGILIERENGVYSFCHLTFQEYLAARYIKDEGLVDELAATVDDDWWLECTLLYAARSDVSPIIEACLRSGTVNALTLAVYCADERVEIDPELQDRLDRLRADVDASTGTSSADSELRRVLVGVEVKRQFRQAITLSGGSRLCTAPVTTSLYRLFQADMAREGADRSPDHGTAAEPDPQDVAVGIRGGDAVEFARWAGNLITGEGTSIHRLPTRAELEDPRMRRLLRPADAAAHPYTFWLQPERGAPARLWVPEDTGHPRLVDDRLLLQHLVGDVRAVLPAVAGLLFIRAGSTTMALLRLLELARELDLDVALASLPRLSNALTAALDSGLVSVLGSGIGLDLGLDVGLSSEPPRVYAAVNGVRGELADDLIRDLIRALAKDLVHDLALGFGIAGGTDDRLAACDVTGLRDLAKALDHDVTRDLKRSPDRYGDSAGVMAARDRIHDLSLSRALSHSISAAVTWPLPKSRSRAARTGPWGRRRPAEVSTAGIPGHFAGAFAAATGLRPVQDPTGRMVPAERLTTTVSRAVAGLRGLLAESVSRLPSAPWAAKAAGDFERLAVPAFTRGTALTAETAARIRLLALCLAAEADVRKKRDLGDEFRLLAASATWLERRQGGLDVPTEAILLAGD